MVNGRGELRLVRDGDDATPDAPAKQSSKRSPLDVVMDSVRSGTGDPLSISLLTGMDVTVVRACLDHLVRTGRLQAEVLASACSGVCGGCPATQLGCGTGEASDKAVVGGRVRGLRVLGMPGRR